jgi:hypothetical protein
MESQAAYGRSSQKGWPYEPYFVLTFTSSAASVPHSGHHGLLQVEASNLSKEKHIDLLIEALQRAKKSLKVVQEEAYQALLTQESSKTEEV